MKKRMTFLIRPSYPYSVQELYLPRRRGERGSLPRGPLRQERTLREQDAGLTQVREDVHRNYFC